MPLTIQTSIELLDSQDISAELEVSRQRVHQLASRADFPRPIGELNGGRVWRQRDIHLWAEANLHSRNRTTLAADPDRFGPPLGIRPVPDDLPRRDPNRKQNDPWDVDACQYLLRCLATDGLVGRWNGDGLLIAGREQPTARPELVAQADGVFRRYGVERRPDPDGRVIHFFRTDPDAPSTPASATERRAWRRHAR